MSIFLQAQQTNLSHEHKVCALSSVSKRQQFACSREKEITFCMECKVRKLWRKFQSGTKAAYPTFLPSVELMPSRPVLNRTWVVDQLLVFLSCLFLKTVLLKKNLANRLLTKLTWYVFVVVALINAENNRLMSFFSFGCIYAFSFREVFQKNKTDFTPGPSQIIILKSSYNWFKIDIFRLVLSLTAIFHHVHNHNHLSYYKHII